MVTDRVVLSSLDGNILNSKFNGILPLMPKSKLSSFTRSHSDLGGLSHSDLRAKAKSDWKTSSGSKTNSFNIFNTEDDNDGGKDDGIDAYASKLKFKLKMAIRKLNHQNKLPTSPIKFSPSLSNSSTKLHHKTKSAINYKSLSQKKITKPLSFKNSVNVNLTKQYLNKKTPSTSSLKNSINLNDFIKSKQSKLSVDQSHLKLFSIKKESPFYNNQKLPLISDQGNGGNRSNSLGATNSLAINSIYDSGNPENSLPSINKILKTPLKLTSVSTIADSQNNDDNDQTIDDETIDESNKKCTSSPLKHFATPNSFSVAKSLLQLGSGYYN